VDENLSVIKQVPIFQDLSDDVLKRLLATSRIHKYRKGVLLISEGETGESLILIISGRIKIFVSDEDGNEMTLFVETPGGYIGEISLLDDAPRTASAVTMESTKVISISKRGFDELIRENPDIALNIIAGLSKKIRRSTEVIRSLAKYSYSEFGKMIGASREMVGKVMADLLRGGYLEEHDKKLRLLKDFPHDW